MTNLNKILQQETEKSKRQLIIAFGFIGAFILGASCAFIAADKMTEGRAEGYQDYISYLARRVEDAEGRPEKICPEMPRPIFKTSCPKIKKLSKRGNFYEVLY